MSHFQKLNSVKWPDGCTVAVIYINTANTMRWEGRGGQKAANGRNDNNNGKNEANAVDSDTEPCNFRVMVVSKQMKKMQDKKTSRTSGGL